MAVGRLLGRVCAVGQVRRRGGGVFVCRGRPGTVGLPSTVFRLPACLVGTVGGRPPSRNLRPPRHLGHQLREAGTGPVAQQLQPQGPDPVRPAMAGQ